MTVQIELKIADERLKTIPGYFPARATPGSAGIDLRAMTKDAIEIFPGETILVPSGLSVNIQDPNICLLIIPRSGLGNKGLVLGNSTGLIDSDYQGEIMISLFNRSKFPMIVETGDRVAQAFFVPVIHPQFKIVDEFSTITDRGVGGFGHTGHK